MEKAAEMNIQEGLALLTVTCEELDISLSLHYDTGRFVNGVNLDRVTHEPKDPKFIEQGPKGWTIIVGGYGITDPETQMDKLYTLSQVIAQGLYMVNKLAQERNKNVS